MKYISLILSLLLFISSVGSHSLKESIESDTRDLENKKREVWTLGVESTFTKR